MTILRLLYFSCWSLVLIPNILTPPKEGRKKLIQLARVWLLEQRYKKKKPRAVAVDWAFLRVGPELINWVLGLPITVT